MLKKFVLGLMILGFAGIAAAADGYVGTWKLNVAKSKFSPGPAPKEVTVVIGEKGADLTIAATSTDAAGKTGASKYSFPMKGGPITYAEGGPTNGTTVNIKRPNANTIEGTASRDAKATGTTTTVLAADGKSFTRTVKSMNAEGKPINNTEVFDKQ